MSRSLLKDLSLSDFNELVSSPAPAPGGGSCAAYAGALGSALTMMVVNLSLGKKSYLSLEERVQNQIISDYEAIKTLNEEFMNMVDEDTIAFGRVMEALKMPQDNDADRLKRQASLDQANLHALLVPLQVAEKCLLLLQHQEAIASYGNKNSVSDVGVGVVMAKAGLEGAILNVKINLPGIKDESTRQNALDQIEHCLREGENLVTKILAIVDRRMA